MNVISRFILIFVLLLGSLQSFCSVVVHPEYHDAPRPQLIPESLISLEYIPWEFAVGDGAARQRGVLRKQKFPYSIVFGFAPEADFSGVNYEALRNSQSSQDVVWYRKEIEIPEDWKGALLTFEGVDYEAEVFINDTFVHHHLGAYAPFDINISAHLKLGKNVITLRALDDRARRDIAVGKQERRPYEGVIFYGNSTGAWKGAHLRKINPNHFVKNIMAQGNSQGLLNLRVDVESSASDKLSLKVFIKDRKNRSTIMSQKIPVKNGQALLRYYVSGAKAWTPEAPTLYDMDVSLYSDDTLIETVKSYTSFGTFEQKKGHFFLNGKVFYLKGVLNQMVFPKGLYSPDTALSNSQDITHIKAHGFNFQRVHNVTPRWRDIYEMETLGLTWSLEMPSARDLRKKEARVQFLKEWKEIIEAYGFGHANLLYFVPGNEDWGMLEDGDHESEATEEAREAFQWELVDATLKAAPFGALVSPGDGWRQITGMKNGQRARGINPSQLILSAHDYRGSGRDLISTYGPFPVNTPERTVLPANGKELLLKGYDFPGEAVAPVLGEFGGKAFAPPGIGNVFGYGHIYRIIEEWTRDSVDQLSAMSELDIFRGGYVYTQVRDAGFKPHRPPVEDKPAGELNGFLTADGFAKSSPIRWKSINDNNQKVFSERVKQYESLEGPITR